MPGKTLIQLKVSKTSMSVYILPDKLTVWIMKVTCPKCEHDRAYFMQIQIRSADEPMSIFYKCCNEACQHQWREG